MLIPKHVTIRDPKHLEWLRGLPCVKTGYRPCDACHIRTQTDGAMSKKPSDSWTIPMHRTEHSKQHSWGEFTYFHGDEGLDLAKQLAQDLYAVTGKTYEAIKLITAARKEIFG